MDMDLTLNQTRVIGCLIEKEITTPDQYPLSINALTLACNQKSNREPVLELSESDVQELVDQLVHKRLISQASSFGSRVVKYKHRFCNTEFGELKLPPQELGIITVLFLRGPQTPGELRSRAQRLCSFSDVHETETVLQLLSEREDGPFVCRLAREPGKREARYMHLFSGEAPEDAEPLEVSSVAAESDRSAVSREGSDQRLRALETEVADLRQQMQAMKAQLDELFE